MPYKFFLYGFFSFMPLYVFRIILIVIHQLHKHFFKYVLWDTNASYYIFIKDFFGYNVCSNSSTFNQLKKGSIFNFSYSVILIEKIKTTISIYFLSVIKCLLCNTSTFAFGT